VVLVSVDICGRSFYFSLSEHLRNTCVNSRRASAVQDILKLFCLEVFIRERELIEYYGVLACVRFDRIEVLNILDANCLGMGKFPKH